MRWLISKVNKAQVSREWNIWNICKCDLVKCSRKEKKKKKKNPHKPSFEAAAIEWVKLHKQEEKREVVHAA